jgi:hypothetical protein
MIENKNKAAMVYDITKHKYTNHSSSKRGHRARGRMDL